MTTLRRTHKFVIAFLLLLVFGLQVQASFACKIADYSGPAEHCCCEVAGHEQPVMMAGDSAACCELSQDVVVKGTDPAQDQEPVLLDRSFDFDLPPVLVAFVALWISQQLPPASPSYGLSKVPPYVLGTQTYLATQRLRI